MEEKKLLKSMVKERDKKISLLREKKKEEEQNLESIKSEIEAVERILAQDESEHEKVVAELDLEQTKAEDEMKEVERGMQENAKLHEYAKLMKSVSQSNVDTTYVLRLQSQLMKSMHSMGLLENQMKLLKKHCNAIVKSLKDEISNAIDEKCKSELDLMNSLAQLDKQKHEMEEVYKQKIGEKGAAFLVLKDKLGMGCAESDQDESSDSDDREAQEKDAELEMEIEELRCQLEVLQTEKESMEQHLRMAIDEKDEIFSKLKEERSRQEDLMKKCEEKKRHARGTAEESNIHGTEEDNPVLTDEGSSKADETNARKAGNETETQCFSDDETSETLRSEWSSGDDDRKGNETANAGELPVNDRVNCGDSEIGREDMEAPS